MPYLAGEWKDPGGCGVLLKLIAEDAKEATADAVVRLTDYLSGQEVRDLFNGFSVHPRRLQGMAPLAEQAPDSAWSVFRINGCRQKSPV
jgi:hypothetical protein